MSNYIYDGPSMAEDPDYDSEFYEVPDSPEWCSKCERWYEDCRCPSPDDPIQNHGNELSLDQIEATCQVIDEDQDRWWEESVRDYPRDKIK